MNNNTKKQELKVCFVDGCSNKIECRGLCNKHYIRWRKYGDPNFVKIKMNARGLYKKCKVEGCGKKHDAKGYCSTHYKRWKKHGDPLFEYKRQKSICKIDGCNDFVDGRGYCSKHYQRLIYQGSPLKTLINRDNDGKCSIKGCSGAYHAMNYCEVHYRESQHYKRIRVTNENKRRTRKQQAPFNDFTADQWNECLKIFGHKCAYCGANKDVLHQEHVIPISRGGSHTKTNIIPSCNECNSTKGTRTLLEWYHSAECYSKEREEKILKYLGYKTKNNSIQAQLF